MRANRRERWLLTGLFGVLLLVVWSQLRRQALPPEVPVGGAATSGVGASRGAASSNGTAEQVIELWLADLERQPGEWRPGRDPFRFGNRRPDPPPPPPPEEDEEEPEPIEEEIPIPAGPQPPPVDLVYLGSFGTETRRLAVFSDGKDIYNVLEGGLLNLKFILVRIGFESADIGFVEFPDVPPKRLAAGG